MKNIKNATWLVIASLIIVFTYKYFIQKKQNNTQVIEQTALIEKEIKNVGKLIVTEGHFSEVFNYKNSKEILGNYITANKKALIIVNAKVTIAYNLKEIEYLVDTENKTLQILKIPQAEVNIYPDLEYYDMQSDFFNPFQASDYNTIKQTVNQTISKKIEASNLRSNAQNRLLSELSKFYILTQSMGWTLKYNQQTISNIEALKL